MVSSDDKIKDEDKIQESLNNLQSASSMQGSIGKPLLYHGQLLAATSEKLVLSVDRLYESSKRLERYSVALVIFTIVLIALTAVLIIIPPEYPWWDRVIVVIFAIVMAKVMLFPKKEI